MPGCSKAGFPSGGKSFPTLPNPSSKKPNWWPARCFRPYARLRRCWGEKLVVRLNPKYVQDFLRVLSPEASFTACLQSAEAPVLFVTEDGSNYVVMPMAL